jgi:hypothetical protein
MITAHSRDTATDGHADLSLVLVAHERSRLGAGALDSQDRQRIHPQSRWARRDGD